MNLANRTIKNEAKNSVTVNVLEHPVDYIQKQAKVHPVALMGFTAYFSINLISLVLVFYFLHKISRKLNKYLEETIEQRIQIKYLEEKSK